MLSPSCFTYAKAALDEKTMSTPANANSSDTTTNDMTKERRIL